MLLIKAILAGRYSGGLADTYHCDCVRSDGWFTSVLKTLVPVYTPPSPAPGSFLAHALILFGYLKICLIVFADVLASFSKKQFSPHPTRNMSKRKETMMFLFVRTSRPSAFNNNL